MLEVMKRILLLAPLLLLLGCVDKDRAPVLGHWTGGFYTDKAEVMRGYVQLYQTGDKFKMQLANPDQTMNFEGTWSIVKKHIELRVADIKFENPSAEVQKALKLRIFGPEQVRSAYAKPIVLNIKSEGTELNGLTMTLGDIQGKHVFRKGAVTPNTRKALDKIESNR
jgi:hypothetical protein